MPDSDRARRLRLLALAFAIGAIIWVFTPKGASQIGPLKKASARNSFPDFTLPAVDGGQWRLSENRGKVMLVNFWATWCPPCRKETPELVNLHNKYASQGFAVIGISLDDKPGDVVPPFVERYRITYPVLVPTEEFALASEIQTLPTSYLLDRDGRIARTYLGAVKEATLAADVETLLNERPAATQAD